MVEVKPYEDTETLKLEDVGHVEKQMRIKWGGNIRIKSYCLMVNLWVVEIDWLWKKLMMCRNIMAKPLETTWIVKWTCAELCGLHGSTSFQQTAAYNVIYADRDYLVRVQLCEHKHSLEVKSLFVVM
jgi:hypothetical protein